jgi:hypothetical protein
MLKPITVLSARPGRLRPLVGLDRTDMTSMTTGVTGGVDTHSDTHHAAALDEVGRLLDTREFPAKPAGYRRLLEWLQSFGRLERVGVEGTGRYGAGVTRFLRQCDLEVIEVNRPNRRSRRVRGKSDPLDAESAARRALAGEDHVIPKDTTTIVEAIRVLRIARTGAVKSRTAAYSQLKDLVITAPDCLRESIRDKTLPRLAQESARWRPDMGRLADPIQATKLAMRTIASRIADFNSEIASLDAELDKLAGLPPRARWDCWAWGPSMPRSCSSPPVAPRTAALRSRVRCLVRRLPAPGQQRKDKPTPPQPSGRQRRQPGPLHDHSVASALLRDDPRLRRPTASRRTLQERNHPMPETLRRPRDLPRRPHGPRSNNEP